MKNRILLLMNYNGNKSRANYTWRLSGKLKNAVKNYQNYFYQFQYKRNVLVEPLRVACGTGFCRTQSEYRWFRKIQRK